MSPEMVFILCILLLIVLAIIIIIGRLIWCYSLPCAPENVRGTWANAEVVVTWTNNDSTNEHKVFYRPKTPSNQPWLSRSSSCGSTMKLDVQTGTPYEIYVVAKNFFGLPNWSATISGCARADAPSRVSVVCDPDRPAVTLTWEAVSCASGYIVKRMVATETSFQTIATLQGSTKTQTEDSSIAYGLSYTYTVISTDRSGESCSSTPIIACSRVPPPQHFVAVIPKTQGGTVELHWQPEPHSLGYHIHRHCPTDPFFQNTVPLVKLSNASTKTYLDRTASNQVPYTYTIASVDAAGIGKQFSSLKATAAIPTPAKLTTEPMHGTSNVILAWSELTGVSGYRVWKSNDGFRTEEAIGSVSHSCNTKFVDSSAKRNVVHSYKVQAVDKTGAVGPKCSSVNARVLDVTPSSATRENEPLPMEVRFGDLTTEKVDAIVVCLLSDELKRKVLAAAGQSMSLIYHQSGTHDCIELPGNLLPCKNILLVPCQTLSGPVSVSEQSVRAFTATALQYAKQQSYRTISFPAIGCGGLGLDTDVSAKAMVSEAQQQLTSTLKDHTIQISFVIHYSQQVIYDSFSQQLLSLNEPVRSALSFSGTIPQTWEASDGAYELRKNVAVHCTEAQSIIADFRRSMSDGYLSAQVIRIERIQNKRWFRQYQIQKEDLDDRLKESTERRLFHGCAGGNIAAKSISEHGFNRNLAGTQHGTAFGRGVYFSSQASESHRYTQPDTGSLTNERYMFVCKVLLGNTTRGDSTTYAPPPDFHSTGNGSTIYVVYHDAQAYAEYLIVYR